MKATNERVAHPENLIPGRHYFIRSRGLGTLCGGTFVELFKGRRLWCVFKDVLILDAGEQRHMGTMSEHWPVECWSCDDVN